jgi:hypothetical protein
VRQGVCLFLCPRFTYHVLSKREYVYSSGLFFKRFRLQRSRYRCNTFSARSGAENNADRECMARIVLKLPGDTTHMTR